MNRVEKSDLLRSLIGAILLAVELATNVRDSGDGSRNCVSAESTD